MILYKKTITVWSDVPGYGDEAIELLANADMPIRVYGEGNEEEIDSTTDSDATEVVASGIFSDNSFIPPK